MWWTLLLLADARPPKDLHPQLDADPLAGLVYAPDDIVLQRTADAARKEAPKKPYLLPEETSFSALAVVKDHGDVVEVRTWLSPRVRDGMTALTAYDFIGFVPRTVLLPMVVEPITETFSDGSAYVVFPGRRVTADKKLQLAYPLVEGLSVPVTTADVGLSIPLDADNPSLPSERRGESLACSSEWVESGPYGYDGEHVTTVMTLKAFEEQELEACREREASRPRSEDDGLLSALGSTCGLGYGGTIQSTCIVKQEGKLRLGSARREGRRRYDDYDTVDAWRGPSGNVLVAESVSRGMLRWAVEEDDIEAMGGVGGIAGMGGGRDPEPVYDTVRAAEGTLKVFFGDGGLAGYHLSRRTLLDEAEKRGDSYCIEQRNVPEPICFPEASTTMVQIQVGGF